ncbi:MAG: hypothetical protein V4492_08255 [Chlamydiota bacterium]
MSASNVNSAQQSIDAAQAAVHAYMFRLAQEKQLDADAASELATAADDINGSIASLYYLKEELEQLAESEQPATEEETKAAQLAAFNAMQDVIDLAKRAFPELFWTDAAHMHAHPDIPEDLIDNEVTFELFERPVSHICGTAKHTFNAQSLVKPDGTPITICPLTREDIGAKREYDYDKQEKIYNYVLDKLAPPAETPAPTPTTDPTQPSAEPAPNPPQYTYGEALGTPDSQIFEQTAPEVQHSPVEMQYGPTNLYDDVYQQLYPTLPLKYACSSVGGAIAVHAAAEALTGAPWDLGKILWEGHKINADYLNNKDVSPYIGSLIMDSDRIQLFAWRDAIPDMTWIISQGATTNITGEAPLFLSGNIPQSNLRSFFENIVRHLVIHAAHQEDPNLAIVIATGNSMDVRQCLLLQISVLEGSLGEDLEDVRISIFDPHGTDELPASLSSFSRIDDAAIHLASILPYTTSSRGPFETYQSTHALNQIALYPLMAKPSQALPLLGSSSTHSQQYVGSSSSSSHEPLQHPTLMSSSSSYPVEPISLNQVSIMQMRDIVGTLKYWLTHMHSDPDFQSRTHESYASIQQLPGKEIANAVYFEYYKILTEELRWTPDGSFNWAERCFLSENFARAGLPTLPHMVYLRLKAIENALKLFG